MLLKKVVLSSTVALSTLIAVPALANFNYTGVQVGKRFEVCHLARDCEKLTIKSFKRANQMVELVVKGKKQYKISVQCSQYSPMVRMGNGEFERIPLNAEMAPSAVMTAPTEVYLKACHNATFEQYDKIVRKFGYSVYEN